LKILSPKVKPPTPVKLPTGTILKLSDVRYTENPNQSQNVNTFESFTIDVSQDTISPAVQKEITQHLLGEKTIDPQRLQAIQEGRVERVIVTKGIATTFTPTDKQIKILQAMERQKQQEKLAFEANRAWQEQRDSLDKKIAEIEAQKKKTQEFRNRSNEEILKNFIKVQTQKEQQGLSPDTNLNKYLAERGYDVTKPETIPTSALKPNKLDTADKLLQAGLSPSLVNVVLASKGLPIVENQVQIGTAIDTEPIQLHTINYHGIQEQPSPLSQPEVIVTPKVVRNDFVPPVAHNTNKPVGKDPTTVSTTGLGSIPQSSTTQTIAQTSAKVESEINKLPIPLIAGILLLGT